MDIAKDHSKPIKLTKAIRKEIKQIADSLLPTKYAAYVKSKDVKGNWHKKVEYFPVNHQRRLEKAYEQNGKQGISDYIKKQTQIHKPI